MSAIDPNKRAIIAELQKRRSTLAPEKAAILDELSKRYGMTAPEPAPTAAAQPEARSVGGFLGNVAKSGGNFLGGIASAVMNPIDTVSAIGGLAAGTVEKLIPGEQGHEKNFDALFDMYVERYGGVENLKKTLYEDPVGVLADVATLAGGVGVAAKVGTAAKVGKLQGLTKTASAVARTVDPISAGAIPMKVLVAVAKKTGVTPEWIYRSALKPSKTNTPAQIDKLLKTGLDAGIPVSKGGLEKLGGLIDDLNDKVKAVIDTDPSRPIDRNTVAGALGPVADKFKNQVAPRADLKIIGDTGKEFIGTQPPQIRAADAQKMKQGTYKQLKSKAYGEMKSARIEAEKGLARGLKEELAKAFPELSSLNAKESAFIGLDKALEQAVQRIGNHQLIGIGTPIAAAAGGAVTGSATGAAAIGILKAIIDNPNIKSRIAIGLNSFNKRTLRIPGTKYLTPTVRIKEYLDALNSIEPVAISENNP